MTDSVYNILAWRDEDIPRVRTLLGMRKFWSGPLYGRLRDEYDEALDGRAAPKTGDEAWPIVDALPSLPRWAWLDRYIQDRLWQDVAEMVDARADELARILQPKNDDLGTLRIEPNFTYPDYYQIDFHRQGNGIWRDDRGAAIYAMGARVVHVGRNNDFQLHDAFARNLDVHQPQNILDLACGFGKTTFSLKKRFPEARVEGIDLSVPCLRLARRMATEMGLDIDWRQGDVVHLPYDDNSFDLLTTTMALHELPVDAIRDSFAEARRVLKLGGVLIALENPLVGEPLRDVLTQYHSQIIVEPFHYDFRRSDLAQFARDAGFTEAVTRAWSPFGDKPGTASNPRSWVTPWSWIQARK